MLTWLSMLSWPEVFLLLSSLSLLVLLLLSFTMVILTNPFPVDVDKEHTFVHPATGEVTRFPRMRTDDVEEDEASESIVLSIVVPAYNESSRLPSMLSECVSALSSPSLSSCHPYEVIVVDDGSVDKTAKVAMECSIKLDIANRLRVLQLSRNRGKGGAVRQGVFASRGQMILFVDADGATDFNDLTLMIQALHEAGGDALVCGSRAHLEEKSIAERSAIRTVLMHAFHCVVKLFGTSSIKDTQCGFKLMSRRVALQLFSSLHIERWAFDVELIKIAEMLDTIPVKEVQVRWQEKEGSKLNVALDSLTMLKDLFLLWFRYAIGAWKIKHV